MLLNRFIHHEHPFVMMTDGKEFRFAPVSTELTTEEQWETAVRGELLPLMLKEYERLKQQQERRNLH